MNAPTPSQRTHADPARANIDLWLERTRSAAAPKFRLFCFPYAGGNAAMFRDWAKDLALNVEVCAIRLPGRERRYSEPGFLRTGQVVESLLPILRHFLDLPYAMFGYSMGAVLAYEVARGLLTECAVEPRALLVAAHIAPQLPMRRRDWYTLPRNELIAELKALKGTPPEVFENEDLVDLVLPMLRSDLELIETYRQPAGPMLSCPVIAMGGTDDPDVTAHELAGWSAVTSGAFKSTVFEGDHFFINSMRGRFLQAIREELGGVGVG